MPSVDEQSADPAADGVREWLTERVAFYLDVPIESVDTQERLTELGLDSVYVMTLSGDIEEHYDLQIDPTIVWDYPTVETLTKFVGGELASR